MNEERVLKVLLSPCVTEKSTRINVNRQYVFKVLPSATKPEIKAAVKLLFEVDALAVGIVNVKPEMIQRGRTKGRHPGWKKAYITLKEGQSIASLNETA